MSWLHERDWDLDPTTCRLTVATRRGLVPLTQALEGAVRRVRRKGDHGWHRRRLGSVLSPSYSRLAASRHLVLKISKSSAVRRTFFSENTKMFDFVYTEVKMYAEGWQRLRPTENKGYSEQIPKLCVQQLQVFAPHLPYLFDYDKILCPKKTSSAFLIILCFDLCVLVTIMSYKEYNHHLPGKIIKSSHRRIFPP